VQLRDTAHARQVLETARTHGMRAAFRRARPGGAPRGLGEQMVVLDTGGLARGVYVVCLTAGRLQAIRRVVSLP